MFPPPPFRPKKDNALRELNRPSLSNRSTPSLPDSGRENRVVSGGRFKTSSKPLDQTKALRGERGNGLVKAELPQSSNFFKSNKTFGNMKVREGNFQTSDLHKSFQPDLRITAKVDAVLRGDRLTSPFKRSSAFPTDGSLTLPIKSSVRLGETSDGRKMPGFGDSHENEVTVLKAQLARLESGLARVTRELETRQESIAAEIELWRSEAAKWQTECEKQKHRANLLEVKKRLQCIDVASQCSSSEKERSSVECQTNDNLEVWKPFGGVRMVRAQEQNREDECEIARGVGRVPANDSTIRLSAHRDGVGANLVQKTPGTNRSGDDIGDNSSQRAAVTSSRRAGDVLGANSAHKTPVTGTNRGDDVIESTQRTAVTNIRRGEDDLGANLTQRSPGTGTNRGGSRQLAAVTGTRRNGDDIGANSVQRSSAPRTVSLSNRNEQSLRFTKHHANKNTDKLIIVSSRSSPELSAAGQEARMLLDSLEDPDVITLVETCFDEQDVQDLTISRDSCLLLVPILLSKLGSLRCSLPKVICSRMIRSLTTSSRFEGTPTAPRLGKNQAVNFLRLVLEFIIEEERPKPASLN